MERHPELFWPTMTKSPLVHVVTRRRLPPGKENVSPWFLEAGLARGESILGYKKSSPNDADVRIASELT